MRKGSTLPRYRCWKCEREQSHRKNKCRYCGGNLKLIRYGFDSKIRRFDTLS